MISSTELLIFFTFLLGSLYFWINYRYSYWKRKNIPYIPATPIIGNLKDIVLMRTNGADCMLNLYNHKLAKNESIVGIHVFHTPALLIREPELIKNILIKDFNKFPNRYSQADPHNDALGAYNLFFLRNQEWKTMRGKLSPIFTSGRMKQMFSLVCDVAKQLDDHLCDLSSNSKKNSAPIEMKETFALYATDVIASVAFGIQANSLKNPNGDFRRNGRKLFDFTVGRAIELTTIFFLPQLVYLFNSKIFSKESTEFLRSTIDYIMEEREKSGTKRNDLIDTLITLKNASFDETNNNDIQFKGDVLVAQAAVFFTAGFETTSATMAFALYELSRNLEAQNRLRDEIKNVLVANNGEITYDTIQNMEYLHMILQETLRMYPPLPFLDRQCVLPKNEDGYSLEPFSHFKIPHGMPVYIPAYAIQRDPKYYPNPDVFNPERFSTDNKTSSSIYLPFGTGPHNCIGERFGMMQAKIGLISIFKNHYVRPSEKTPVLQLERKALTVQPAASGVYCEIFRDPLI